MSSFPYTKQFDSIDCGPACLHMICRYYKINISFPKVLEKVPIAKDGTSLLDIAKTAEGIGFKAMPVKIQANEILQDVSLPCILHLDARHFVVLYKVKRNAIYIADPAKGRIKLSLDEFYRRWVKYDDSYGVAVLLEFVPERMVNQDDLDEKERVSFQGVLQLILPYKKIFFQIILSLLLGSLIQLALPFITQSIVDVGINTSNLDFIYVCLFGQLFLLIGKMSIDFIKNWMLIYVNNKVNIRILTGFINKLMQLPIVFFDSRKTGDIMQRMSDHTRVRNFLTGSSLNTLFSFFSLITYSIVLAAFSQQIFVIFLIATLLYFAWILLFIKPRRQVDNRLFEASSQYQTTTIQLLMGMQEIKLNGLELTKRWNWERNQARMLRIGYKVLSINQIEQVGVVLINEGKNILITFMAAKAVISGEMSIGTMLAIQYVIGILTGPTGQMVEFLNNWQLSKLSVDRLNEIHLQKNEEDPTINFAQANSISNDITFKNVSFNYPGAGSPAVLKNLSFVIPKGKVTAIVGTSGSGKTTLLKLLLKFYEPVNGTILHGTENLKYYSHKSWRKQCGVVMQDSYIFSDTIAKNIATDENLVNIKKLQHAVKVANIEDFIENLPLGYNTRIGPEGMGISMGQRQRILIARAVYRNPELVLFDEATNSLDANNESQILNNLKEFFDGKTVVVVAHRLSTVKNADQIIVLNKGVISEFGSHKELIAMGNEYYTLVKNQLELGN